MLAEDNCIDEVRMIDDLELPAKRAFVSLGFSLPPTSSVFTRSLVAPLNLLVVPDTELRVRRDVDPVVVSLVAYDFDRRGLVRGCFRLSLTVAAITQLPQPAEKENEITHHLGGGT